MSEENYQTLDEATVWETADFPDPASFAYTLSSEMIEEIAAAAVGWRMRYTADFPGARNRGQTDGT